MSSELLAAVQSLQQSVDRLATAVASLPSPSPPGCCDSDFVIGIQRDGYEQAGLSESLRLLSSRWVEEGPPEVPAVVINSATDFLSGAQNEKEERVRTVFGFGFWAKAAVATNTSFTSEVVRGSLVVGHWVILKSHYGVPFRVASFSDLIAFVDLNNKDTVCQGLESITDVEVFCCGAGVPVPPLWRPTKKD